MGSVVTGASVAFLITSTVAFASSGEVITDKNAFTLPFAVTEAEGTEGAVFRRGRDDLHCAEKWLGFWHFVQVLPYALHCVERFLLLSPCLGPPQQMHCADLCRVVQFRLDTADFGLLNGSCFSLCRLFG